MKTIHRIVAAIASAAVTYSLFTAVISEARPPVETSSLAQAATSTTVAVR